MPNPAPRHAPLRWEAHACLPLHPAASFAPLERYRSLGVHYVSVNVGMDINPLGQMLPVVASFRTRLRNLPDRFVLASSVADIEKARDTGRLAVGFDLEGALPLLEQPDMVALWRDLGVRQLHFAYNRNNAVAGGCHDRPQGLTALGRQMVEATNDAGVLMDCAHTERRSTMDIMAHSRHPVVFSHANPLALVEHGRNISDEQIRACAATGGVVCISGVSSFLGSHQPSVADMIRHIHHVADLVGPQHVGIGMDIGFAQPELSDEPPPPFDANHWWPPSAGYSSGLASIRYVRQDTWNELPSALLALGMTPLEADGVLGENMVRVARQVWDQRKP